MQGRREDMKDASLCLEYKPMLANREAGWGNVDYCHCVRRRLSNSSRDGSTVTVALSSLQ